MGDVRGRPEPCSIGAFEFHQRVRCDWSQRSKVINNLHCVNGDKSLCRQWHQGFVAALGQYEQAREEIAQRLVKETDLCKDLDKPVEELKTR